MLPRTEPGAMSRERTTASAWTCIAATRDVGFLSMDNAPSAPELDPPHELDCEQCGVTFRVPAQTRRSVPCPHCGAATSTATLREPLWWTGVAGMALAAIAVPGLAYRTFGPSVALPVAGVTLVVVWVAGRKF
jgi:uncharacterized paraquat-inducible protein A